MKLGLLGGVAASALVAMIGTASAGTYTGACGGGGSCTVITSGTDYVLPALPFTPLNLGTGASGSTATINNPSSDISSIVFSGGSPASGLYSGSLVNSYLSPFGGSSTSANPTTNYLVAGAPNSATSTPAGSVTINYTSDQTSLLLFWGTVDPVPSDYNKITFEAGGQTITGADIAAIVLAGGGGTLNAGAEDVGVIITGLSAFNKLVVSDNATPAFEFALGVPAPPIGHGLPVLLAVGGMLFGGGLLQRGRKRSWLATVIPEAGAV